MACQSELFAVKTMVLSTNAALQLLLMTTGLVLHIRLVMEDGKVSSFSFLVLPVICMLFRKMDLF